MVKKPFGKHFQIHIFLKSLISYLPVLDVFSYWASSGSFSDIIFGTNLGHCLATLWTPIWNKHLENNGSRAACKELTKMIRNKI